MQLICGLLGHRPSPLRALVAWKGRSAPCLYCQRPLVRRSWSHWEPEEEQVDGVRRQRAPDAGTALTSSSA